MSYKETLLRSIKLPEIDQDVSHKVGTKLLIVLGEGGHTKEMLTLVEMLGGDYEYGYVMPFDDGVSEQKLRYPGKVFRVIRPRDKVHHLLNDIWKTLRCALQCVSAVRRFKPTAVISAGPSLAVPACFVAKLMGAKVIFVETGSRITALSFTGKLVYPFADLYFVQSEQLTKRYKRAIYAGRLF